MGFFSPDIQPDQSSSQLWGRVLFWCALITFFSSIPNLRGEEPNFETAFGTAKFIARKLAHLFEYGILLIYVYRASQKSWTENNRWLFLLSFTFAILFSLLDEWHQTFVIGRSGNSMDIFVDTLGSFFGALYAHDWGKKGKTLS